MATAKQGTAKRLKMAERARQQKDLHFPDVDEGWLWHRSRNDGYTTLPRTLPIIMEAVDALSKGTPAGHTLFTLWCRAPDHALVTIENPAIFAAEAGFSGERTVDTWRRRMKILVDLGFILTKPGAAGDYHYVLLRNPNFVLEMRREYHGDVPESIYGKFLDRILDVGAFGEIETIRNAMAQWKKQAEESATQAPPSPPPPSPQNVEAAASGQKSTHKVVKKNGKK